MIHGRAARATSSNHYSVLFHFQTEPVPTTPTSSNSARIYDTLVIMANELVNRPPHTVLGRRLWWLILGRAAGVVLLLLLGAIWKRSTLSTYLNSLRGIAQIIFTVAALSLIYCGAHLLW